MTSLTAKYNTLSCDEPGKLLTLVAGKRRRLFLTGDDDEVFMKRSWSTLRRVQQSSIFLRSGKSETEVIIIDCTVKANY